MRVIRPYLVAPTGSVTLGQWRDDRGEEVVDHADFLISAPLRFTNLLEVKTQALMTGVFPETGASLDDFAVTVVVASDKTKLRIAALRVPLAQVVPLDVAVEGMLLGGTVTVTTRIILDRAVEGAVAPEPGEAGSILYEHQNVVRVEGAGPQMPSTMVSFRENGWPAPAKWTVGHTRPEELSDESFHEPLVEHLQLWINSDEADFNLLFEGENPDFALRMVARDVAQAIMRMGSSPDFSVDRTYPPGSLGEQIVRTSNRAGVPPDDFAAREPWEQGAIVMKAVFRA